MKTKSLTPAPACIGLLVPVSQVFTAPRRSPGQGLRNAEPLHVKRKLVQSIATRSLELADVARGSEVTGIPASSLIGEGEPAILDCNGGIKIDAVSSFFYPFHLLFRATMFLFFRRACSQVSPRAGAFRVLQPGSEDGGDQRGSIKQLGCFLLLLLGELAERSKPGPDPGPTHLSSVLSPVCVVEVVRLKPRVHVIGQ